MVTVPKQVAALGICAEDWERTPVAVRTVLLAVLAELEAVKAENRELRKRIEVLEERLNDNSGNSSAPPSADDTETRKRRRSRKGKRKRRPGGQPGHPKRDRARVPPDTVEAVRPQRCECCHRSLVGIANEGEPAWHQVTEVPPVKPHTTEYQMYGCRCPDCGHLNKAALPDGVPRGAFGPRLQALLTVCTGVYRLSRRTAQSLMRDFFGVDISLGSVANTEQAVSEALEGPVAEAQAFVEQQQAAHVDETGWWQRASRAFLWVLATPLVVVYMIHPRRAREAARQLLAAFKGVLVSDRYIVYANWPNRKRQVCWAHLMRAFQKMADRRGGSKQIGESLLASAELMFHWWHRVRDGTLKRSTFRQYMSFHRVQVEGVLARGSRCRHRKTAATCKEILKVKAALWTFVRVEGVEPTNNAAEQALRGAVIWRKTSFGSWSEQGSRFVERMLTVAATLRKQKRDLVDYIVQVCTARLHNDPVPSLLPAKCSPPRAMAA
jgi:transposase